MAKKPNGVVVLERTVRFPAVRLTVARVMDAVAKKAPLPFDVSVLQLSTLSKAGTMKLGSLQGVLAASVGDWLVEREDKVPVVISQAMVEKLGYRIVEP